MADDIENFKKIVFAVLLLFIGVILTLGIGRIIDWSLGSADVIEWDVEPGSEADSDRLYLSTYNITGENWVYDLDDTGKLQYTDNYNNFMDDKEFDRDIKTAILSSILVIFGGLFTLFVLTSVLGFKIGNFTNMGGGSSKKKNW